MIKFYLTALVMALASCLSTVAASYSGTLPVMFITTENSTPITSKETYLNATYYLDPMGTDATALGSKDAQTRPAKYADEATTPGQASTKPYRIKFAAKTAILGMKKAAFRPAGPCRRQPRLPSQHHGLLCVENARHALDSGTTPG